MAGSMKDYPGKVADNSAEKAPPFPAGVNPADDSKRSKTSRYWMDQLEQSEEAYKEWNTSCDNIDKLFGSLQRLSNAVRDKEFQLFWANIAVMGPSIYARPPVPVVVPKFKDRRPVFQVSAEVMERCCIVAFDDCDIDDLMIQIRDDVILAGRGVAWPRFESAKGRNPEKVSIDFKHRRDFLHSVSRNWAEVGWVAAAAYLTAEEAKARFEPTSGDAYKTATYRIDKDVKDQGGTDETLRAKFWEIWSKLDNQVYWVTEGVEDLLDVDDPHMEFRDFFPCPRPAYSTLQRGSLIPIPDVMYYKDQLDEVNLLTGRIHALSEALEVKGFYPAGGAELGDAVEAAVKMKSASRILVPVSNWAAFGGTKEVIIWLPIDMIANVITGCVQLRKQVIDDIYQIMGLSDIMRGATDPQETLGAQQLKTQYGSVRVRDKQRNMAHMAKALVLKTIEVITEKFSAQTILQMCQMQLPTKAELKQQMMGIEQQLNQQKAQVGRIVQMPQVQQAVSKNPGMAQQGIQQFQQVQAHAQQMMTQLASKPTVEDVMAFIRNNRARAYVLDIETDSTIFPDEQLEKQRRAEFMQVLSQLLPQLAQLIAAKPESAQFCGELLKFAIAPYRVGRSLDGAIDQLVAQMEQGGSQQQQPSIQQQQLEFEQQKLQWQGSENDKDRQLKMQEAASQERIEQMKMSGQQAVARGDAQNDMRESNAKVLQIAAKTQQDKQKGDTAMMLAQQKSMLAQRESENRQAMAREDAASRRQQAGEMHQQRMQQAAARPPPAGPGGLR